MRIYTCMSGISLLIQIFRKVIFTLFLHETSVIKLSKKNYFSEFPAWIRNFWRIKKFLKCKRINWSNSFYQPANTQPAYSQSSLVFIVSMRTTRISLLYWSYNGSRNFIANVYITFLLFFEIELSVLYLEMLNTNMLSVNDLRN